MDVSLFLEMVLAEQHWANKNDLNALYALET